MKAYTIALGGRHRRWRGIRRVTIVGAGALALVVLLSSCSTDAGSHDPTQSPTAPVSATPTTAGSEEQQSAASDSTPVTSAQSSDVQTATNASEPATTSNGEPQPSSSDAATESDVAAPGFADPEETLSEDSFDGADLTVNSIDLQEDSEVVRVVITIDGQGFPGWQAEYADQSGSPSSLVLTLIGVNVDEIDPSDLPASDHLTIDVEEPTAGDSTLRLELAQEPAPYRVHLQYSPLRVVVEFSI